MEIFNEHHQKKNIIIKIKVMWTLTFYCYSRMITKKKWKREKKSKQSHYYVELRTCAEPITDQSIDKKK